MATATGKQPKKTPARRCLTHLPATCEAALSVMNDAAWEILTANNGVSPPGVTVERVLDALTSARKILKDGLFAAEPKRGGE